MTGHRRNIDDLQGEIQELFADLWQVPQFAGLRPGFRPQCDCYRTDDPPTLHVVVELPGVELETLEVVAAGQTVVISGNRERPTAHAARYLGMEIDYGTFRRRLELGEETDPSRATATYERGMLEVTLPIATLPPASGAVPIEVIGP